MRDTCKGFATDPATCLNEETSEQCAYQKPSTTSRRRHRQTDRPYVLALPAYGALPRRRADVAETRLRKADELTWTLCLKNARHHLSALCWLGRVHPLHPVRRGYAQGSHLCRRRHGLVQHSL